MMKKALLLSCILGVSGTAMASSMGIGDFCRIGGKVAMQQRQAGVSLAKAKKTKNKHFQTVEKALLSDMGDSADTRKIIKLVDGIWDMLLLDAYKKPIKKTKKAKAKEYNNFAQMAEYNCNEAFK